MASAGQNEAIDTTGKVLFTGSLDGGNCHEFGVFCYSGSTVHVNVAGLHKNDEFFPVRVGSEKLFSLNNNGIGYVTAKTLSGIGYLDYGVMSKISNF